VKEGEDVEEPVDVAVGHIEGVEVRLKDAVDVPDAETESVGDAVADCDTVEVGVFVEERE
jgi:hypothetical protein